jgi:hypothetical protein
MFIKMKNLTLAAGLLLSFAAGSHATVQTVTGQYVREITFCNENSNYPYVLVYFEGEPDFDGDAGTGGLGFWYNSDAAKGLLSVFESALLSKTQMKLVYEKDAGSVINRWRSTAPNCPQTNPILSASVN